MEDKTYDLTGLTKTLRDMRAKYADQGVMIRGDAKLNYQDLADVLAVCPIVGGKSLKGPSDQMLTQLGFDVSALGVARMYQDICSTFVIDSADAGEREAIQKLGMKVAVTSTAP